MLCFLEDIRKVGYGQSELLAFKITIGNKSNDQEAVPLLKPLRRLAFGDKSYIGNKIFKKLISSGLKLTITCQDMRVISFARHQLSSSLKKLASRLIYCMYFCKTIYRAKYID